MAGSTGSMTVTEYRTGMVKLIKFDWVTGSSSQTDDATGYTTFKDYDGQIIELATIPDGTAAPTASYDLAVVDKNSLDVLCGGGADRHTSSTEYKAFGSTGTKTYPFGAVCGSSLTLNVTNAGTEKRGLTYLFIR